MLSLWNLLRRRPHGNVESRRPSRSPTYKPGVEVLEDRITPANYTFAPVGRSGSLSVGENWQTIGTTQQGQVPVAADNVVIPALTLCTINGGACNRLSVNGEISVPPGF